MDSEYAGKLGVDIDGLLISQPDSGEQALKLSKLSCARTAWT
jgi:recombination protein RecA